MLRSWIQPEFSNPELSPRVSRDEAVRGWYARCTGGTSPGSQSLLPSHHHCCLRTDCTQLLASQVPSTTSADCRTNYSHTPRQAHQVSECCRCQHRAPRVGRFIYDSRHQNDVQLACRAQAPTRNRKRSRDTISGSAAKGFYAAAPAWEVARHGLGGREYACKPCGLVARRRQPGSGGTLCMRVPTRKLPAKTRPHTPSSTCFPFTN
jgi:hypothetical protein